MRLFKKNTKGTHLYSRWAYKRGGGLYPDGLISGIKYSLAKGWAYIRGDLKPGGLKSGILRYTDIQYMRACNQLVVPIVSQTTE